METEKTIQINQVIEIIEGLLKTKKTLRIYPVNNPISVKITEEGFQSLENFLLTFDEIKLTIQRNRILYQGEEVYTNEGTDDNLSLFLFKDGLREIAFKKGFTKREYLEFLGILNTDFQKDMIDDDVVTLLWEREFEHLKYIVDEDVLYDSVIEQKIENPVAEELSNDDSLSKAFHDAIQAEEKTPKQIVPIDDEDIRIISEEIEHESENLTHKIIVILIELLFKSKGMIETSETVGFLSDVILYSIKQGDFNNASAVLYAIKMIEEKNYFEKEKITLSNRIFTIINDCKYIEKMGRVIDSNTLIREKDYLIYIEHLDASSIPNFISILGEIKTDRGRRLIVEALSHLGRQDIKTLAKGLNDTRWLVLKLIISILGKMKEKSSVEYLRKGLQHSDARVRRETVKALGNLSMQEAVPLLKIALTDSEKIIRITAADALGKINHASAKNIILNELKKTLFTKKDFHEKKKIFSALAGCQEDHVISFLLETLKKRKLLGRKRNDETRACAAYVLGISGVEKAIPVLDKTKKVKNKLLRSHSQKAFEMILNSKNLEENVNFNPEIISQN